MSQTSIKPVLMTCANCGRWIGERRGNTFARAGLEVEFKRTHDLVCECGSKTPFVVDRHTASNGRQKLLATTGGIGYSSK